MGAGPATPPTDERIDVPHRVFDSHLHIIDPGFPLVENDGFLPDPFTVADYRARTSAIGIAGGAVVSGSFQQFDQGYLIAALEQLGDSFVGVTQLPGDVSDDTVRELDAAGVRAVRFNVRRGGSAGIDDVDRLARRATTSPAGTPSSTSTRVRSRPSRTRCGRSRPSRSTTSGCTATDWPRCCAWSSTASR